MVGSGQWPVGDGALARYREAGVDQVIAVAFALDRDSLLSTLDTLAKNFVEPAAAL